MLADASVVVGGCSVGPVALAVTGGGAVFVALGSAEIVVFTGALVVGAGALVVGAGALVSMVGVVTGAVGVASSVGLGESMGPSGVGDWLGVTGAHDDGFSICVPSGFTGGVAQGAGLAQGLGLLVAEADGVTLTDGAGGTGGAGGDFDGLGVGVGEEEGRAVADGGSVAGAVVGLAGKGSEDPGVLGRPAPMTAVSTTTLLPFNHGSGLVKSPSAMTSKCR